MRPTIHMQAPVVCGYQMLSNACSLMSIASIHRECYYSYNTADCIKD